MHRIAYRIYKIFRGNTLILIHGGGALPLTSGEWKEKKGSDRMEGNWSKKRGGKVGRDGGERWTLASDEILDTNTIDYRCIVFAYCCGVDRLQCGVVFSPELSILLLLVFCCSNSRSMTHITWQAAVLQDILEAAVDDRRQAAVDVEEQRPQLQDIFEAAIDGNHV